MKFQTGTTKDIWKGGDLCNPTFEYLTKDDLLTLITAYDQSLWLTHEWHSDAYSEPYQTFKMEGFVERVNG